MQCVRLLASGLLRLPGHGIDVLRSTSRHIQPDRADPVHDALIHPAEVRRLAHRDRTGISPA